MEVPITDVDRLYVYAEDVWRKNVGHSRKDFDKNADTRTKEKFINDRVVGKCGEMAFCAFIEHVCGYTAEPNLTVYDTGGKEEYADIESINGSPPTEQLDIKTTKPHNKWFTMREAVFNTHSPSDPVALALVDPDTVHRDANIIMVDLVGWMRLNDFSHYFKRGDRLTIPGTDRQIGPPLKTNNYAYPIENLSRCTQEEWEYFVHIISDVPFNQSE